MEIQQIKNKVKIVNFYNVSNHLEGLNIYACYRNEWFDSKTQP